MSASFRSHFRHATPKNDPTSDGQRGQSSRIPTRPSTVEGKSKAVQHVSKLAKRASRTIVPIEKTDDAGAKPSARELREATRAYDPPRGSQRDSVIPSSEPFNPEIPTTHHSLAHGQHRAPPLATTTKTPSLVSGSSASTLDSPRVAMLRRKPSSIGTFAAQKKAHTEPLGLGRATMSSQCEGHGGDAEDDTVLEIALPPASTLHPDWAKAPGYERVWNVARENVTPPTVPYAQSTTPSTRYTDSPFSHVPTPSSASSYSPAVTATISDAPRPRQVSPSRNRPPSSSSSSGRTGDKSSLSQLALPPVRESSTSSSNSTARPSSSKSQPARKEIPRKTPSAPPSTKSSGAQMGLSRPKTPTFTSSSVRPPIQIPPELAHLNVDPPSQPTIPKTLPPQRPSRTNTPSIMDMGRTTAVVHSDLPRLYTTYHKRTPSQETAVSPAAPSPGFKARFGLSSKSSSRQASPRVDSAISPPPSARNFARGSVAEAQPPRERRVLRKDSPAIGPPPSPSKSPRFNIFSRKTKGDGPKVTERPKRQPMKGPAAGTGHEGYGRFGFRGRSGSSASNSGFRSPSADSSASSIPSRPPTSRKTSFASSKDSSELDDFLRERLTPVILRGSGSTVQSTASTTDTHPMNAPEPSSSSSLDSYPKPQLLPSAMRENSNKSPLKRPSVGRRFPSESSEDDVNARFPTLAAQKSSHRLSRAQCMSPANENASGDVALTSRNGSFDSYVGDASFPPQANTKLRARDDPFDGREGLWLRPQHHNTEEPSRKWNFLQRAHASPRPKGKERAASPPDMPQTPYRAYPKAAQYAMFDPVEPVDLYEIEKIVQENETSPEDSMSDNPSTRRVVPYEARHTSFLPAPPKAEYSNEADFRAKPTPRISVHREYSASPSPEILRAQAAVPQSAAHIVDIPKSPNVKQEDSGDQSERQTPDARQSLSTPDMPSVTFKASDKQPENGSPRQPRLSPVGRIPRVVSKRDREYKLPDHSFSRPFVRTQPHPHVKPPGTLYNQIRSSRELTSPADTGSQPLSSTSTRSEGLGADFKGSSINTNAPSASTNRTSLDIPSGNEFMAFSPRKDSETSYSSSSGNYSLFTRIASQPPQEDDPWTEYDDLVNAMLPGSLQTPVSAGSSLGAPFQYGNVLYDGNSPSLPAPLNISNPPSTGLPPPPRSQTVPVVLSVPQQITRFMQPSMSPLSPHTTISEFMDHYGNRSTSTLLSHNQASAAQQSCSSTPQPIGIGLSYMRESLSSSRHSRTSMHSRSASLPEANTRNSQSSQTPSARFNRETQLLEVAEDENHEQAMKNQLRYGALMTSKWLSFGRVLFSPAHHEMRLSDEPRVLVIDGLGSDWSYYVALNYQDATVYDLTPAISRESMAWPGFEQKTLSNLRHIPYQSLSTAFPFPKGFFTAVVFRFPIATTDQAYHSCICECKRVLRPGGHLEVTVLDIDLTNMGTRARSLVRGLKTRMQQHDPTVSLRNLSDFMVRLIGKRGFENIQRCVVGVPAAGRIPRSQDISSISSGNSGDGTVRRGCGERKIEREFSFADLLEDTRNTQIGPKSSDEGITKMVAKVGRLWYSTCYETALLKSDRSIWDDQGLLRECEKQGTSFRLLICYAQKPTQARRRTVSV